MWGGGGDSVLRPVNHYGYITARRGVCVGGGGGGAWALGW